MNYHTIKHNDMLNGSGLRVVLFLSACTHACHGCHNSETWSPQSGIPFDDHAKQELFEQISKDYISGITFTGGDPLHENNLLEVSKLINEIRVSFPDKTIWLYTGYTWDEIWNNDYCEFNLKQKIIKDCDVVVDGRYIESLHDVAFKWAGSTNQRVINVKKTLDEGEIILWES